MHKKYLNRSKLLQNLKFDNSPKSLRNLKSEKNHKLFHNLKSQAALEFLTTYVWAIMVMLIVIGALYYFGIFDFSKLLPQKYSDSLISRSLGATFTAHAIGGAFWIWTIPITSGQWIALIPIVIYERLLFPAGIAVSYVAFNALFDKVLDKLKIKIPSDVLRIEKRFTLKA